MKIRTKSSRSGVCNSRHSQGIDLMWLMLWDWAGLKHLSTFLSKRWKSCGSALGPVPGPSVTSQHKYSSCHCLSISQWHNLPVRPQGPY